MNTKKKFLQNIYSKILCLFVLLVLAFYAVFTPVSTILGGVAVNGGLNPDLVFIITLLSNFILEFLYTRFVVYRNSCDTRTAETQKKD